MVDTPDNTRATRPDLRRLRRIAAHPNAKAIDRLVAERIAAGEDANEATDAVMREHPARPRLDRSAAASLSRKAGRR